MCGIAGILSLGPGADVDPSALRSMAGTLAHRGPDDEGYYLDRGYRCGLAFRRLSIIDLAGGHQPLANEDRTIWVVFNGEIYNFRALRAELESRGHRFATRTDGETIVHLYEEHGERCFSQLDGMFAVALWDERVGRLLLARDRFGKKPLHYASHGAQLYFASELKALLALPELPRQVDPQSLHRYLVFQYVPAPHSIYRGYHKLLPAHYLRLEARQACPERQQPYWQLEVGRFRGSYADARARLGELLTSAVQKRLIADVPLGAFLSGGIDSSVVVALMRKLGVEPLRTFCIGFPEAAYDETAFAREVAAWCRTEHHERLVTPRAQEVFDALTWHFDEPFGDSSAIPTYYLARWTRQFVTVALTGDGGDECFAGYDRYRAAWLTACFDGLPRGLRRALAGASARLPHHRARAWSTRLYRLASRLAERPAERYLAWVQVFGPAELATSYTAAFGQAIQADEPAVWFEQLYDGVDGLAAERANRVDWHSYLPYDLLTKVDLASMAHGLECRSPFLDRALVEFSLSLPISWRMRGHSGKRILKEWAVGLVPPAVLRRPKMGFGVPLGVWFRNELRDLLRDRLLAGGSLSACMFGRPRVARLVEAHISGRANHEHRLWALLMLELWYARWRPSLPAALAQCGEAAALS